MAVAMKEVGRLIRKALHHRQICQSLISSKLISRRFIFSSSTTPSSLVVGNSGSVLSSDIQYHFPLLKWTHFRGQKRSMFIETQSTPNPSSLMFYPGKAVMEVGSADIPNARSAMNSPLAKALHGIDGQPLFLDSETAEAKDTAIHEDDSETVAMIKELLETRIRPAVQDDETRE